MKGHTEGTPTTTTVMNNEQLEVTMEDYIVELMNTMCEHHINGDTVSVNILDSKIQDIIQSYENGEEFLYIPINFGKPSDNSQFEFWYHNYTPVFGILLPVLFPLSLTVYYLSRRYGEGLSHSQTVQSIIDLYHQGISMRDD